VATDAIPLPKPEPRAVREHFAVPSIRSREIVSAHRSGVRHRKGALQPLDFSDGLLGVHSSSISTTPRERSNGTAELTPPGFPIPFAPVVTPSQPEGRPFPITALEFSVRIGRRRASVDRSFASFRPRSVDLHGDGSLRYRQSVQQQSSATGVLNCEGDCLERINQSDSCGG
jgi:hypothetical protein